MKGVRHGTSVAEEHNTNIHQLLLLLQFKYVTYFQREAKS